MNVGINVISQTQYINAPCQNRVIAAKLLNGQWYMDNDLSGYGLCDLQTHWMPLPSSPETKG